MSPFSLIFANVHLIEAEERPQLGKLHKLLLKTELNFMTDETILFVSVKQLRIQVGQVYEPRIESTRYGSKIDAFIHALFRCNEHVYACALFTSEINE